MMKYGLIGLTLAAALAASGCHQLAEREAPRADPLPPPPSYCTAEGASWAHGQHATDKLVERAKMASGAQLVRVLRPGEAHTMEFNPDRLNLEVDERDRIVEVRCG